MADTMSPTQGTFQSVIWAVLSVICYTLRVDLAYVTLHWVDTAGNALISNVITTSFAGTILVSMKNQSQNAAVDKSTRHLT